MTTSPPTSAAGAPRQRSAVRTTGLACFCLFVAMLNLTLVVAGLKELVVDDLGGTVADAALFFTVEMAAYLVFAPVWGAFSDRLGRRKPFIVAGFAASGLLYFAYLWIHSIPLLLALRFLQGGAAIAGWSTTMALLFDRTDPADPASRARLAGFAGASLILGVGLGAPIGGLVTQHWGGRAPLALAGVLFLLLALAALALSEAPAAHIRPRLAEVARALTARPRLLLPWGLYAMERFTVGLFVIVFPLWLLAQHGAEPAARGRALAAFLLPFAFLQLGTYRLARRFGPFALLALGCGGYAAAFAALGRVGDGPYYPLLVVLGALAAMIFPPTLALTAEWTAPETRASALAGFNVAGSLGFALGPIAGAWVQHYIEGTGAQASVGFTAAFDLAAATALAGALAATVALLSRRWHC
jgi:MFS transporter, DHA1 family, tetracycline resistance protein